MKVIKFLITVTTAEFIEVKEMIRESEDPLEYLQFLVAESNTLIDSWPCYLPSSDAWKVKFETNAARMERSYDRKCGHGFIIDRSRRHGKCKKFQHKDYSDQKY